MTQEFYWKILPGDADKTLYWGDQALVVTVCYMGSSKEIDVNSHGDPKTVKIKVDVEGPNPEAHIRIGECVSVRGARVVLKDFDKNHAHFGTYCLS